MAILIDLIIVLVVTAFCLIFKYRWQKRRLVKMMNIFNGPPTLPIVGNALTFACATKGESQIKIFLNIYRSNMQSNADKFEQIF